MYTVISKLLCKIKQNLPQKKQKYSQKNKRRTAKVQWKQEKKQQTQSNYGCSGKKTNSHKITSNCYKDYKIIIYKHKETP